MVTLATENYMAGVDEDDFKERPMVLKDRHINTNRGLSNQKKEKEEEKGH